MTELQVLTLLVNIPLLYSLGGMYHKGLRRYCIPLLLLGMTFWTGTITWQKVIAISLFSGILHLGYGDSHSNMKRFCYALGLSLPTLVIAFNWWFFAPLLAFLITWFLSNNKLTAKYFPWRVCEFIVGSSCAVLWSQIL